jgi:sortase A
MGDKRCVEDLTIEELEQALLVKRQQARQERLRKLGRADLLATLDEPDGETPRPATPALPVMRSRSKLSRLRDSALLTLEVLALVGLIVVLLASLFNLRTLNQEVALARESTATPAPVAVVAAPTAEKPSKDAPAVLPGAHSPPNSVGSIPQRLADLVQPVVPVPIPTPGPKSPTRIVIPAIKVDAPVVEGDDWEQLKKGAGHHIGSANPGERGNVFISAHNDIFGEIFRDLDKVELEDEIIVYAGETPHRYVVKAKRIVEPTDVSVMAPTASPILTLMTCYPYMIDTQRIVVIAQLVN